MILKLGICHAARWVRIRMENIQTLAPEKITEFLGGSTGIEFTGQSRAEQIGRAHV